MENVSEGLEYIDPPRTSTWLDGAPESVMRWFRRRYGEPTEIQRAAWSRLPSGQHLLLSAPTGAGKTLAAFLPLLTQLLTEADPPSAIRPPRCLYVSPLKALSNDTYRTLATHIEELSALLPDARVPRLAVRSGDSTAAERRRLRTHPPDILLTTPESVAVLLSQPMAHQLFAGLRWVIVDEVHALAACKRGADLALSLERLTRLAEGHLQRIGLSATATPLTEAARWLASGRCAIARAGDETPLQLTLVPLEENGHFLAALVDQLMPEVRSNRATLVFTNTRRLAEQLSWALRRNLPEMQTQIAVHHSSLAAERRREVEEGFKQGRLRAVVSSTSLELGIDIGTVDLAVLVHPPGDVIRLLQRVGRAGHGPGRVKRGLVLTATEAELLEAAVTAASGQSGQCEPLRIPAHPLDVLCQHILGMAAAQTCSADETFDLVRRAAPYRDLSRRDFDDCLAYLGCRPSASDDWLPPRLRGDPASFTLRDSHTARLLRRNLGTILADPAYEVYLSARGREEQPPVEDAVIGQVDRLFAERLRPGDRFLLDGRCLQVRSVRPEESVLSVEEVSGRPVVPRWGGEGWPLSTELARRLYLLRVQAAESLREGKDALRRMLCRDYVLDDAAALKLADFFERQECVSEIPDTMNCLVEAIVHDSGADYYIHTPLNRLGNDALARVAVHRLARDCGRSAGSIVADLGFALLAQGHLGADESVVETLRKLLAAPSFEADLDVALEDSAMLRERFQRVAQTGLMLLRQPLGQTRRVGGRDWGARRLFEKVQAHDRDFVLLRQARREVRAELCDTAAAGEYVRELERRPLRCRWLNYPSPFVESWTQMAAGAAQSVETPDEALLRLHASLIEGTNGARSERV
ncbi:MAG TPA: DEAD/DEAH box helicase [Gemmataceae bacterium]|jgi:ATP-dependent Lhr-like helicase